MVAGLRNVQAVPLRAGLAFILINRLTGSIFGVTSDILADKAATVHTVLVNQSRYLITSSVFLEAPALNMGVFVGIISGSHRSYCLQQIL